MGYPTVTADRAFKALHEHQVHSFTEGQEVGGELAAYLAATGAPVTVVSDGNEGAAASDKPVEKMTVKELKAHADALGVDLGEAKKKDQILAAITAAGGDDGDDEQGEDDGVAGDAG